MHTARPHGSVQCTGASWISKPPSGTCATKSGLSLLLKKCAAMIEYVSVYYMRDLDRPSPVSYEMPVYCVPGHLCSAYSCMNSTLNHRFVGPLRANGS